VDKTFDVILKLKEVELELLRLKNALEMMNRAYDTKKEWVGLTDDEIIDAANMAPFETMVSAEDYIYIIARAIEAKLKEKNNG
jgi:hypothetical protein